MEEKTNIPQLARELKNRHVQLIALGGTIGTGLFLGAGESIKLAGPSILLAYGIAGIACFLLMRALGELLVSNLGTTSFVDFIKTYLGQRAAFVVGWTYWSCWIAIAMAELTAAGLYVQMWFPNIPVIVTALSLLVILFCLNIFTVSAFGETEFWFSVIKIVAIVGLIIVGIMMVVVGYKTPYGHASLTNLTGNNWFAHGAKGFFLSFQMVLFSFTGVEMIGMTASETKDPEKIIPKSINEVPQRVMIFYIGSLLAIMCIYPWQYLSANTSPFVQVFSAIGIKTAAAIINFVVLTAAASSCNSAIFTTGRMIFSMTYGSKSKLGQRLGSLSLRQIPKNGIIFSTMTIAIIMVMGLFLPGDLFTFIASVATTCFLFVWGMIILAHLKYRHSVKVTDKETSLKFKMPLYPISDYFVLIFFLIVTIVLFLRTNTRIALIASIIWLTGLWIVSNRQNRPSSELDQ